jgi:hypothetical protein
MQQQAALAGNFSMPPPPHHPSAPMHTLRYDINNPPVPPFGTDCYKIRHVSNYEFSKPTKEFSLDQFLARWESYCELTNAAFPVALISSYLTKEAATWFTGAFAGRSLFTITWVEFCAAIHASSLVDIMADQRALDDAKALVQGGSSIKNYIIQATTIYNGRLAHKNLKHYPEFYFMEMFRSGLSPEIKARLPAITDSTYFTAYTSLALTIGVPLESAAAATLPPPTRRPWTPSRGGGGGGRFGQRSNPAGLNNVLPTPPDSLNSLDEAARAAWERTNCTVDERRQLRMQRGACTYCGISSHTRDKCPELAKRATGTNAIAPLQDNADLNAVRFDISPPN